MRNPSPRRCSRSQALEARQLDVDHLARRGERAICVVVLLERRPEDGEDPVARVRDERPAVREDRVAHLAEVVVQDVDHGGRPEVLGAGREVTQVGEEHGRAQLGATEPEVRARARQHLVDDAFRHESREDVPHALALERGDDVGVEDRGGHGQRERRQRVDDRDDETVIEGDLGHDQVRDAGRERREHGQGRPDAQAQQRREHAERENQEDVEPRRRALQRGTRAAPSRSRVHARSSAPLIAEPVGVGVNVLQARGGRADDHDLFRERVGREPRRRRGSRGPRHESGGGS